MEDHEDPLVADATSNQWQYRDQHGRWVEMSPEARRLQADKGGAEHAGLTETRTDPPRIPERLGDLDELRMTRLTAGMYVTSDGEYALSLVSGTTWQILMAKVRMRLGGTIDYPSYDEARRALAAFLRRGPSGLRDVNQEVLSDARRARQEALAAAAVRRVRTPEGVAHYGQPIGTIITRDPVARVQNAVADFMRRKAKADLEDAHRDAEEAREAWVPRQPPNSGAPRMGDVVQWETNSGQIRTGIVEEIGREEEGRGGTYGVRSSVPGLHSSIWWKDGNDLSLAPPEGTRLASAYVGDWVWWWDDGQQAFGQVLRDDDGQFVIQDAATGVVSTQKFVWRLPNFVAYNPIIEKPKATPAPDGPPVFEHPWLTREDARAEISDVIETVADAHFHTAIRWISDSDTQTDLTGTGMDSEGSRITIRIQRYFDPIAGVVNNNYFTVDGRHQGTGFATEVTSALEALYVRRGVMRVHVGANIDVGGYAWAKRGFDFEDPSEGLSFLGRIDTGGDPDLTFKVDKMIERHRAGQHVTPIEIAMLGHEKSYKVDGQWWWFGKEFMLGTSWAGTKSINDIDPRVDSMTEEQWDALLSPIKGRLRRSAAEIDLPAAIAEIKERVKSGETMERLNHRGLSDLISKHIKGRSPSPEPEYSSTNSADEFLRAWSQQPIPRAAMDAALKDDGVGNLFHRLARAFRYSGGHNGHRGFVANVLPEANDRWTMTFQTNAHPTPIQIAGMPPIGDHTRLNLRMTLPQDVAYGAKDTATALRVDTLDGLGGWLDHMRDEGKYREVRLTARVRVPMRYGLDLLEPLNAEYFQRVANLYDIPLRNDGDEVIFDLAPEAEELLIPEASYTPGMAGGYRITHPGTDDPAMSFASREQAVAAIDLAADAASTGTRPITLRVGPARPAFTAGGDSWRWQLRDKNGQWIEMGSEVRWLAKGLYKQGIVVGSPSPGTATVKEYLTNLVSNIPSNRLEVVRSAANVLERVYARGARTGPKAIWQQMDLSPNPALRDVVERSKQEGFSLSEGWGGILPEEVRDAYWRAAMWVRLNPPNGPWERQDLAEQVTDMYLLEAMRPLGIPDEDIQAIGGALVITLVEDAARDNLWRNASPEQRAKTKAVVARVQEDAQINIAAPMDVAWQILEDRFRSQFDTGDSNGMLDPGLRAEFEMALFGLHPDVDTDYRTIYGYVTPKGGERTRGVTQYGDVRFVLKPGVRSRTTFTIGDSLGTGARPVPLDGQVTDRQAWDAVSNTYMGERVAVAMHQNPDEAITRILDQSYIEAQIHNGVGPEDIERIVLTANANPEDVFYTSLLATAESLGIPVIHGREQQKDPTLW